MLRLQVHGPLWCNLRIGNKDTQGDSGPGPSWCICQQCVTGPRCPWFIDAFASSVLLDFRSLLLKRERWKGSCTTWFREASQKLFVWATIYVLEESTRLTPETHQEPNGLWWRKWYLEVMCSREGSHSSSREQGDWRWKDNDDCWQATAV